MIACRNVCIIWQWWFCLFILSRAEHLRYTRRQRYLITLIPTWKVQFSTCTNARIPQISPRDGPSVRLGNIYRHIYVIIIHSALVGGMLPIQITFNTCLKVEGWCLFSRYCYEQMLLKSIKCDWKIASFYKYLRYCLSEFQQNWLIWAWHLFLSWPALQAVQASAKMNSILK